MNKVNKSENTPPYISDDFQIGPGGAYEAVEYSIPIYENGVKTEWSVDGIVGDEKYQQLLRMSLDGKLPIMINTTIKQQKVMNKMKLKAVIWTLVVLMVWVLITLCFTFYPNECFWIIMGLSGCLFVWATYNVILNELKKKL